MPRKSPTEELLDLLVAAALHTLGLFGPLGLMSLARSCLELKRPMRLRWCLGTDEELPSGMCRTLKGGSGRLWFSAISAYLPPIRGSIW